MIPDISKYAPEGTSLRLQTLIRLRWAAILGQLAVVTLVYYGLNFDLKFVWCVGVVLVSVWLNIFLSIKYRANTRMQGLSVAALLGYDIVQLSVLLFLTGGLHNPFALFLLAPATIAAGSLLLPYVLALNILTLFFATFLAFYHLPLPWKPGEVLEFSNLYIAGVWGALLIGMAFFSAYVWRLAEERRHMNEALTASEMVLAREQKLSALDGMAAAMAHELGTPLSTISVAAKEMLKEVEKYPEIADDIDLIHSQSLKCREVLSEIAKQKKGDLIFTRMSLEVLLSEVIETHKNEKISIKTRIKGLKGKRQNRASMPVIERNPAILYGLGNIVSNAVRYARKKVLIRADWDERDITITVEDDGPGFDSEIIEYLGEPIIPKLRQRDRGGLIEEKQAQLSEGMGLGLFIAKTFLERSEAKVSFKNKPRPLKGARVEIIWEKSVFSP